MGYHSLRQQVFLLCEGLGTSQDRFAHCFPHTFSHLPRMTARWENRWEQPRNVLVVVLGTGWIPVHFSTSLQLLLAGYSWMTGVTPQGLGRVTAGSNNNKLFRISTCISSSRTLNSQHPPCSRACFPTLGEDLINLLSFSSSPISAEAEGIHSRGPFLRKLGK